MLSSEDRLLIFWNTRGKTIPTRPQHPERFPEHDARHWYDSEFAGWGIEKTNIPESPGDGPQGKKVACLMPGTQHPYHLEDTMEVGIESLWRATAPPHEVFRRGVGDHRSTLASGFPCMPRSTSRCSPLPVHAFWPCRIRGRLLQHLEGN